MSADKPQRPELIDAISELNGEGMFNGAQGYVGKLARYALSLEAALATAEKERDTLQGYFEANAETIKELSEKLSCWTAERNDLIEELDEATDRLKALQEAGEEMREAFCRRSRGEGTKGMCIRSMEAWDKALRQSKGDV